MSSGTLQVTLPSPCEVVLTRVFDAPRQLVFDALTKPELLARWFGPRGWTMEVCEVDVRVGGRWRFVMRGPNGERMGMGGVHREIDAPDRRVYTESFDEYPGEAVVTTVLTEHDGKTTLVETVLCESQQIRDGVLQSGMEEGAAETYDRLAELLPTIT